MYDLKTLERIKDNSTISNKTGFAPETIKNFLDKILKWGKLKEGKPLILVLIDSESPGSDILFEMLFYKMLKPDIRINDYELRKGEIEGFNKFLVDEEIENIKEKVIYISGINSLSSLLSGAEYKSSINNFFSYLLGINEGNKIMHQLENSIIIINTRLSSVFFQENYKDVFSKEIWNHIEDKIYSFKHKNNHEILRGVRASLAKKYREMIKANNGGGSIVVDTTPKFDRFLFKAIDRGCDQSNLLIAIAHEFEKATWKSFHIDNNCIELDISGLYSQNEIEEIIDSWNTGDSINTDVINTLIEVKKV